jgi:hypothetical protein
MSVPQEVCLRNKFMRFSLWTSVLTFCVIEGYALQDQLAIGHASAIYMIGTACVAAGACIGLFAFLITIGLVISALWRFDASRVAVWSQTVVGSRLRIAAPGSNKVPSRHGGDG